MTICKMNMQNHMKDHETIYFAIVFNSKLKKYPNFRDT